MKQNYPSYYFGIFRIIFGLYLILHFSYLLPVSADIWSNIGILSDTTLNPTYATFPNILYIFNSPSQILIFVTALCILSFFIMIGFFRRSSSLFLWYGWACLFHQNNLISNPSIAMIGWLLLALSIIPVGEALSVSNKRNDWYMPKYLFWGAWIILAISYTISGFDKLMSPSWFDGSAMSHLLDNPLARDSFLRDILLNSPEVILKAMTYTALFLEMIFGFLCIFSKTRAFAWFLIMGMHIGILCIIDFADLTFGVIMIHLFTFDPDWFKPKLKKKRIIIFDGVCGFCNKSVNTLIKLDSHKIYTYSSLQGELVKTLNIPKNIDSIVYYQNKKLYYKSTAILKILGNLGGIWGLTSILFIIPRFLRDFVYDIIAKYRYKIFGELDTCRMPEMGEEEMFIK
ncbi:MAG: Unknown protein [uncultured Campylobacterales bacterium]|uniref:HTTM-like domain-containing protein n=1 Tax=uncultured Campylobacterales bacterium TaxID=352960 RepID=A0A6S6T5F7_9BACT|nr:MAG: Unknown protein [uncultured Campylobacterales bacterium]